MLRMFAERLGIEPDAGIQPTVRRLTDIRLLSLRPGPAGEDVFSMHEVVGAGIEQGIEQSTRQGWHSTIAAGLVDLVAERLPRLDVTERYELLGMCVAHGVAGSNPMWAAPIGLGLAHQPAL